MRRSAVSSQTSIQYTALCGGLNLGGKMADWKNLYNEKKTDLKTAVEKSVKSGDQIVLGHCAGVPVELTNELKNHAGRLKDVRVFHMVPLHDCWYCDAEWDGTYKHTTIFAGGPTRGSINEGRGDLFPASFPNFRDVFATVRSIRM